MSVYGIVLFHNSSSAMRAEATLKKVGMSIKLVPTPRELSSDCGVALRFPWESEQEVDRILTEAKVVIAGIYEAPK